MSLSTYSKAREDGNDVLIRCDDPDGNCALFADTPAPWGALLCHIRYFVKLR